MTFLFIIWLIINLINQKKIRKVNSTQLSCSILPNGPRNTDYNFHVYMLRDNSSPLDVSETIKNVSSSDGHY